MLQLSFFVLSLYIIKKLVVVLLPSNIDFSMEIFCRQEICLFLKSALLWLKKIYSVSTNKRKDFYGIYDERYVHQFQPQPRFLEQLSNDHGDHLNPYKNSHKLYDEIGHLLSSLK